MVHLLERNSNPRALLIPLANLRQRLKPRSVQQIANEAKRDQRKQIQHRLTPDETNRLAAQHATGDSIHILAARWGMSRKTVSAHLARVRGAGKCRNSS